MSDLLQQAPASSRPAKRLPAVAARRASATALPPGRVVFALQRQLLLRARGALFSRLAPVGGVPTVAEDARQEALDRRAARASLRALRRELEDAILHLAPAEREHWTARAPAVLAFGARQHDELARLVARPKGRSRVHAVARFQLAASMLDWIGDEQAGGADVARVLPAGALPPLVGDAGARRDLVRRTRDAAGATRALVAVLVAFLERVAPPREDAPALAALLGAAWDAELASFAPEVRAGERAALARRKSELPTLACGAIAALALAPADRATVERAAAAMAPLLSTVDDLADLGDDLRTGQLNALAPACARDERSVGRALRDLLAGDAVERHAAAAAACILRVDEVAREAGTPAADRAATMEFLRTRAWRWLS